MIACAHLTVLVGDVSPELAEYAKQRYPHSFLLHDGNWNEVCTADHTDQIEVYTCLGDLSLPRVHQLLRQADLVIYYPPQRWSDGKDVNIIGATSTIRGLTEYLMLQAADHTHVENLEAIAQLPELMPLQAQRHSDRSQIWFAGCSVTYGHSVNPEQCYTAIVGEKTDKPVSVLAYPGASNLWAADQILRSDIRTGDIVIWGVTCWNRQSVIHQEQLLHICPNSYMEQPGLEKIWPATYLTTDTCTYHNMNAIRSVENFIHKIGAELVIFNAVPDDSQRQFFHKSHNFHWFPYPLIVQNNTITGKYIDFGTDNLHPGPKQHQAYAVFCLDKINL